MSYFFEDPMETEIKKLLEKEGYNVDVYINQDDTFNNNQYEIQVDSLNVENWNDFIKEINAVSDSDVDVNFTPISAEELFSMGLDIDACADLIPIVEE